MIFRLLTILTLAPVFCLSACGPKPDNTAASASEPDAAGKVVADAVALPRTPSPDGARVFFISPADGDTVSNPIHIEFGIEGMSVVKAGDKQPDSGHHHLLIDTAVPDPGAPVPADAHHVHFGDGSTATDITLDPGQRTLRLLLADYLHIPHDPPVVSDPITITVE
ncbi:MAG: DUF4399 domain-containing protein [Gammaproteobacteria bacterium]|nr:DUF4399 domain-containing protein [Gammaproteobacteria bacterium]MBU2678480.1 DUF4399 domain-containing protein [Gammaproteobacteria bacterium]NNL52215.1 DUF4399 domain-containing protein [Woeseiaceae bacterium]